jgi:thiol-disulfide isomerase/thioredoxin
LIALETPRPLPPLNFVNGDGAATTLAAFHGRIVLLNVWATWCGFLSKGNAGARSVAGQA